MLDDETRRAGEKFMDALFDEDLDAACEAYNKIIEWYPGEGG